MDTCLWRALFVVPIWLLSSAWPIVKSLCVSSVR
uniref:Uncharacterized protein n=1 Tax=Rhizophora mucronata TaxID=61149 RepID=A0A2P2QBR9_RHIMU